jgi:hypothetical protein
MAAPIGNQFWKNRTKHGRDRLYAEPNTLWEAACEYFEWCESNPILEDTINFYQGAPYHEELKHQRVKTMGGLWIYLGIFRQTWDLWKTQRKDDQDFIAVISLIEEVVREDKLTGAVAGVYNANIISRDLGLADKTSTEIGGINGDPIRTSNSIEWVIQPVKTRVDLDQNA